MLATTVTQCSSLTLRPADRLRARAARIYNKHLDAACNHEPLTQMVLRDGDITWFDPNWYQTVRRRHPCAPSPALHCSPYRSKS